VYTVLSTAYINVKSVIVFSNTDLHTIKGTDIKDTAVSSG